MEILILYFALCLCSVVAVLFRKRKAKKSCCGPRVGEIAHYYLQCKAEVDAAKFYVVLVDLDMGIFMAYCAGERIPPIFEFGSFDKACAFAKEASIDANEHEKSAGVYRGRKESLAIYHDGEAL